MSFRMQVLAVAMAVCLNVAFAAADPASADVKLDIREQPLGDALNEFGRQAGLQVVLFSAAGEGLTAPRVVGQFKAREGLERLLVNSGLSYEFINQRTVVVRGKKEDEEAAGAPQDGRLKVADGKEELSGTEQPGEKAGEGKEEGAKLEEIVVTAQKRKERLKEVPISISVLSGADLDASSYSGIIGALNTTPGIVTFSGGSIGGGTTLMMRGVSAGAAVFVDSGAVGYYLDAAPVGMVRSALVPDGSAYDLERVEVLRGPQGTLYGANSMAGLMRVLTKDADLNAFELKGRARMSSTEGGSESYRGDMAVNVPIIDGKLAVRAVAGYENAGGWVDGVRGNDLNDGQLRTYRLKVNAQPVEGLSVGLSAWVTRDGYGERDWSDKNKQTVAILPEPTKNDFDVYSLKVGYDFGHFSITSMTSYLEYLTGAVRDFTPLNPAVFAGVVLNTDLDSKVFSQELILNSADNSAWRWTAGGFYRDAKDRRLQSLPPIVPSYSFADISKSYAAFGQIGRRFGSNRWEWALGLRYFHDDETTRYLDGAASSKTAPFNSTTPRAVLSWYLDEQTTLYASYSQGFRSGFSQDPGIGIPADFSALKPDKLTNYEIGAKTDFLDRRLSVDSSVYFMDWKDIHQDISIPFSSTFVLAPLNAGTASGIGVDLAITVRPLAGLEIGLSGSWNDLTYDENVTSTNRVGDTLVFSKGQAVGVKYTASTWASYGFPLGASGYKGRLSGSVSYLPGSGNDPNTKTGNILNDRLMLALDAPSHWSASLFVDNITNEYFSLGGSDNSPFTPRPRPRTVGVQLEAHF